MVTAKDFYPLARIDDLFDSVVQAKFVTKIDFLEGYYQIGLTDRAKFLSALITPLDLFQNEIIPFGSVENADLTVYLKKSYFCRLDL